MNLPTRLRGAEQRTLQVGGWRCLFEGLDPRLAVDLEARWGRFLEPGSAGCDIDVRVLDSAEGWLEPPRPGETYRLEAREAQRGRVVLSYGFAVWPGREGDGSWSVALAADSTEPAERRLENAARVILAHCALASGGFALHAGGVLHEGWAFVFAGPSRSGKTTAIRSCSPAPSLGDDFAIVVRHDDRWCTAALPFDNSERIAHDPPRGWHPVAWIWRLFQDRELGVEHPRHGVAAASLMTAVAFPWLFPQRSGDLLTTIRSFVGDGRFAHLRFDRESDLWSELINNPKLARR